MSLAIAFPDISHHTHVRGKRFSHGTQSSCRCFVFVFFQVFQYLRTFQLNNLAQMNQWNILHANQPSVPEATPAPGFERLMPSHRADQLVPTSTAQGKELKALVILHKTRKLSISVRPKLLTIIIESGKNTTSSKKSYLVSCFFNFSFGRHFSDVLPGTLDERRGRI